VRDRKHQKAAIIIKSPLAQCQRRSPVRSEWLPQ
jgi:hypothetical protein